MFCFYDGRRVLSLVFCGTSELAVQRFHLSHFHDLSKFGLWLIGAQIAQVMALVCIDVSMAPE